MGSSLFPEKRGDGSFSVAIMYSVRREDTVRTARHRLRAWIEKKREVDHVDMTREFSCDPFIEVHDPSSMQVVLNCMPSAVLWKGLMVELAGELNSVEGIERAGFRDLVNGLAHPASIRPTDRN